MNRSMKNRGSGDIVCAQRDAIFLRGGDRIGLRSIGTLRKTF